MAGALFVRSAAAAALVATLLSFPACTNGFSTGASPLTTRINSGTCRSPSSSSLFAPSCCSPVEDYWGGRSFPVAAAKGAGNRRRRWLRRKNRGDAFVCQASTFRHFAASPIPTSASSPPPSKVSQDAAAAVADAAAAAGMTVGGADAEPQRTLYDILGADPSSTRNELKRRYVELARVCHPDALLHNGRGNQRLQQQQQKPPEFAEVAAAWRVLSDNKKRMRYDRTLKAEKFSRGVQDWAEGVGRQAAHDAQVVNNVGKVAAPLVSHTIGSALGGIAAAASEIKKKKSSDKNDGELGRRPDERHQRRPQNEYQKQRNLNRQTRQLPNAALLFPGFAICTALAGAASEFLSNAIHHL